MIEAFIKIAFGYLKKYWLYGVFVLAIFSTWYFFKTKYYNQGYNKCKSSVQTETLKEEKKREVEYIYIKEKNDTVKKKVFDSLKKNPIDDKRDSCLLSGRPFKSECL